MIKTDDILEVLHDKQLPRKVKILVLASQIEGESMSVAQINDFGLSLGLRDISTWNVSNILNRAKGLIIFNGAGWRLTRKGRNLVEEFYSDENQGTPSTKPKKQPHSGRGNALLGNFVDEERLEQIRQLSRSSYDPLRLIRLCEELNVNWSADCLIATATLTRTILDHVPPIFGCELFGEVANNYKGTKSFKDSMKHLEISCRKIADGHLHTKIRKKESLPTKTQVDFSRDLDVLLQEIVRIW